MDRITELVKDSNVVFAGTGDFLSHAPQGSVLYIEQIPETERYDDMPIVSSGAECLETGGSDANYPLIENLLPWDGMDKVKELFKEYNQDGVNTVYKDLYGLTSD